MTKAVSRWGAALMLGVALLAVRFLPPSQVNEPGWVRYTAATQRPTPEVISAADLVRKRMAEWIREQARAAIRRDTASPVGVTVLGRHDPGLAAVVRQLSEQAWRLVPAGTTPVRLWTVLPAEGEAIPGAPFSVLYAGFVVPPSALDGRTCVVVLPPLTERDGPQDLARLRRHLRWNLQAHIGMCSLWKTFGAPGQGMQRWLETMGYRVAQASDWARGRRSFEAQWAADVEQEMTGAMGRRFLRVLRPVFGEPHPAYLLGPDGARCLAGDLPACRGPLTLRRQSYGGVEGGIPRITIWGDPLGADAPRWVSDLILDRGQESFQALWGSPDPMLVAFEAAYGETAEAWTSRWLARRYGEFPRGAQLSPLALVGSLLSCALVIGLLLWELDRRGSD